ncbi:MAG: thioredoxin [Oscillospiraceae bacterium]|nr:thioredoxin [Oscillospiraceae bacterium]
MALQHFDEKSFNEALAQPGLLVVDFWADWCGPCKMLAPAIEQLAADYDGKAVVGKVNVDDEPELAQKYAIMSIPTVMFFKDGEEIDKKIGVMPPQEFVKVIDENL